jgi:hypothetical protein
MMTEPKPPQKIYLQCWDDLSQATWCIEPVYIDHQEAPDDAEYILKSIADELLEALEEVEHQLYNYIAEHYGSYTAESDVFIRQARAAIIKAKLEGS